MTWGTDEGVARLIFIDPPGRVGCCGVRKKKNNNGGGAVNKKGKKMKYKGVGSIDDEKGKVGEGGRHCGTKPGHFETSKIHFPTSEGVSKESKRAGE